MLHGDYMSVLEARTIGELKSAAVRFTEQLGFNTVSVTLVVDRPSGEPDFYSVDNTPAAYRSHFLDRAAGRADPVAQHCKRSSLPIMWDQSTYVNADRGEVWEMQARYGYRCGISTALHLPKGLHVLVGVDRVEPLPKPSERARTMADLQLFTTYAGDVAIRLLSPDALTPKPDVLSARELECLKWTMEGKTAWETARILDISEHTVVRHVQAAARKLDCSSKHQAVVKALRLGLVQ